MTRGARVAFVLAWLSAAPAIADDASYQDFPIGARASGFGGAFGAIANDPSGIYYNPAGLVDISRSSVSVSANLYGLEIAQTGSLFDSVAERLSDLERVFSDLSVIPTSAGWAETFGDKDEDGRARHAYGLGVFIPSARELNLRSVGPGTEPNQQVLYRHIRSDRTILAGASYAYRLDDVLSFGVSGFGGLRTLRDHEQTTLDDGASVGQGGFRIGETTLDLWVAWVSLSFGFLATFGDWSLGATIETPNIHVADGAAIEILRARSEGEAPAEFRLDDANGLDADTQVATGLRVGAAYVIPASMTFSVDLTVHTPVRYRLLDLTKVSVDAARALTVATEVERRLTFNIAGGAERLWTKKFSTAVGLYSNLSSAPPIPGDRTTRFARDQLPRINRFGGSIVLGFFGEHTLTRAGLSFSYGRGDDVIPESQELHPLSATATFRKIEVSELFFYFFLSSTFRY